MGTASGPWSETSHCRMVLGFLHFIGLGISRQGARGLAGGPAGHSLGLWTTIFAVRSCQPLAATQTLVVGRSAHSGACGHLGHSSPVGDSRRIFPGGHRQARRGSVCRGIGRSWTKGIARLSRQFALLRTDAAGGISSLVSLASYFGLARSNSHSPLPHRPIPLGGHRRSVCGLHPNPNQAPALYPASFSSHRTLVGQGHCQQSAKTFHRSIGILVS